MLSMFVLAPPPSGVFFGANYAGGTDFHLIVFTDYEMESKTTRGQSLKYPVKHVNKQN